MWQRHHMKFIIIKFWLIILCSLCANRSFFKWQHKILNFRKPTKLCDLHPQANMWLAKTMISLACLPLPCPLPSRSHLASSPRCIWKYEQTPRNYSALLYFFLNKTRLKIDLLLQITRHLHLLCTRRRRQSSVTVFQRRSRWPTQKIWAPRCLWRHRCASPAIDS